MIASTNTSVRLPDFIYVGTSKAGSTWLYNVLASHPAISLAPGKGTYFFDQHFDRGIDWYCDQFSHTERHQIAGEISHSYLSSPEAPPRIANLVPDAKLLVCLRDPIQRAVSAYLDATKNGRFEGTFAEAIEQLPSLLQRGHYATQLQRYFEYFPRTQIHVSFFDDLKSQPQSFADEVFDFLQLTRQPLTGATRGKMMPAAVPRSRRLTKFVKHVARSSDAFAWRALRGRVKRSRWVRNALYRPLQQDEMPQVPTDIYDRCREHFAEEVQRLDELLKSNLRQRWGYE